MKKILTILFLFLTVKLFACSCSFAGPFMNVYKQVDLTIVAKISSKKPGELKIIIQKCLSGKTEDKEITIYGDKSGYTCYENFLNYKIGETYAFALSKNSKKYTLSSCGEYSLKIEQGLVKGMINEKYMDRTKGSPIWNMKTMKALDFYDLFDSNSNLYDYPCKSTIKYEQNEYLTKQLLLAKSEFKNGKIFTHSDYITAIKENNLPLVEFYIDSTNLLENKDLASFVLLSVESGFIDIVKLFLEKGVDPNLSNSSQFYLVFRAVLFPEMLKLLHSFGAKLNPKGYAGTTTIMHAIREGCIESIEFLLLNGASTEDKSNNGKTVFNYTEFNKRNKAEVIKLLKSKT